jgi:hypothetical protein
LIDTSTPLSPGWWLQRLVKELNERRPRYDKLEAYATGENAIPAYAEASVRDAARRLIRMSRTNFAELAIDAVRERMEPIGFRTGAVADDLGDAEAWRIWQSNALDADHKMIDFAALSMSQAYTIVGPVDVDTGAPTITGEDPREVICEVDPANRRRVIAAAKLFHDEVYEVDVAYLYLPGFVLKAWRKETTMGVTDMAGWEWWGDPQPMPIDRVPVVPFAYRPRLRGCPLGEIEPHLPILDRINYTIMNRLETMTLQAFKQRAIKGVPTKRPDGTEVDYDDLFRQGPGAIWLLPGTADIWESGNVDLGPVRESIKDDARDFCAVTRTPLSYMFPDAAQGSAEGASLTREGLTFKTRDRIGYASESYESTMSLAFLMAGDIERAARNDLEVIWAPVERYSLTERGQAASQATGLSMRAVQERIWQMTPQEIARNEAEMAAEALLAPDPVAV